MSNTEIKEQEPAPDFTLHDIVKNGHIHLQELKGRAVVLYFYPNED